MSTFNLVVSFLAGVYGLLEGYGIWPKTSPLKPGRERRRRLSKLLGYILLMLSALSWTLVHLGIIKSHYP